MRAFLGILQGVLVQICFFLLKSKFRVVSTRKLEIIYWVGIWEIGFRGFRCTASWLFCPVLIGVSGLEVSPQGRLPVGFQQGSIAFRSVTLLSGEHRHREQAERKNWGRLR
jgi:hypothetical protein